MNTFSKFFILGLLAASASAQAGEGHGHTHEVPGTLKAQRGGRIQPSLGGLLLEFVVDKSTNTLKFYPTDGEYKAVPLKDVKITVTTQKRRVDKTPVPLKIEEHNDHFMGSYDPAGRYPYNVDVKATYKGQDDTMQFIVDRN